ncbi:MAG: S8 family peptidase [Actinomycetota bacterium]
MTDRLRPRHRRSRRGARMLVAVAVLVGAVAIGSSGAAASSGIRRVELPVSGRYIVALNSNTDDVLATALSLVAEHDARLGYVYLHALQGFSVEMSPLEALALSLDPRVAWIEQDTAVRAVGTQSNPPWGLDRVDQRNLPLSSSYTYGPTGSGVTAYIIDTGIRTSHSDFGGRARHGYDFVDGDADASDCNGHGTHVAGTVGGSTYGVAKSVSLVGVRVLDCGGSGSGADIIAGIDWVTANHQANQAAVANVSLGTLIGTSSSIDTAVRNSIADGITYAIAAGNGNVLGFSEDACNTSPSRVAEALTVSATDSSDRKASWANYGTCVDVFAPGVGITSAWYTGDSASDTISGTSMASPHVAGVAAQYLETNPTASPATVANAINSNATTGKVTSAGSGSPNRLLYNAFLGAAPSPSPTPTPTETATPSPTPTESATATPTPSPSETTDPDRSTPSLTNGVAKEDANGAAGTWKYYKIFVPVGKASLKSEMVGAACGLLSCNPDLDLYVRKGAKPTTSNYACRHANGSSTGSCTVNNPGSDWWYIGIYVYSGSASKPYSVKATY